jgi:hypothetical protein
MMEVERRAVVDEPELAVPDQHVGVARRSIEVGDEASNQTMRDASSASGCQASGSNATEPGR